MFKWLMMVLVVIGTVFAISAYKGSVKNTHAVVNCDDLGGSAKEICKQEKGESTTPVEATSQPAAGQN